MVLGQARQDQNLGHEKEKDNQSVGQLKSQQESLELSRITKGDQNERDDKGLFKCGNPNRDQLGKEKDSQVFAEENREKESTQTQQHESSDDAVETVTIYATDSGSQSQHTTPSAEMDIHGSASTEYEKTEESKTLGAEEAKDKQNKDMDMMSTHCTDKELTIENISEGKESERSEDECTKREEENIIEKECTFKIEIEKNTKEDEEWKTEEITAEEKKTSNKGEDAEEMVKRSEHTPGDDEQRRDNGPENLKTSSEETNLHASEENAKEEVVKLDSSCESTDKEQDTTAAINTASISSDGEKQESNVVGLLSPHEEIIKIREDDIQEESSVKLASRKEGHLGLESDRTRDDDDERKREKRAAKLGLLWQKEKELNER